MTGGSGMVPMLSRWALPVLTIICDQCSLREQWVKAELLALHGDTRLTDLRVTLTANCPWRGAASFYEQWGGAVRDAGLMG